MSIEQNDIIVRSWGELCERVYDNSWQEALGRFRSNYAFRGLSDRSYDLKTGIMRLCGAHTQLEYHLLRNFQKYAQIPGADIHYSDWRWLIIARHHGLPTRLLDWTYSPFVAMHFATADTGQYDRDAVIWFVDYVKVNAMLPSPLIDTLKGKGANAFTLDMLEKTLPDLESFDALGDTALPLFVEPPSDDARIVNQFAFFSLMSGKSTKFDDWLKEHPSLYGRVIIPKELKWEVRDKLDQANITERLLFPGLDGLAATLTRHYTPKKPPGSE